MMAPGMLCLQNFTSGEAGVGYQSRIMSAISQAFERIIGSCNYMESDGCCWGLFLYWRNIIKGVKVINYQCKMNCERRRTSPQQVKDSFLVVTGETKRGQAQDLIITEVEV